MRQYVTQRRVSRLLRRLLVEAAHEAVGADRLVDRLLQETQLPGVAGEQSRRAQRAENLNKTHGAEANGVHTDQTSVRPGRYVAATCTC